MTEFMITIISIISGILIISILTFLAHVILEGFSNTINAILKKVIPNKVITRFSEYESDKDIVLVYKLTEIPEYAEKGINEKVSYKYLFTVTGYKEVVDGKKSIKCTKTSLKSIYYLYSSDTGNPEDFVENMFKKLKSQIIKELEEENNIYEDRKVLKNMTSLSEDFPKKG